MEEMLPYFNEKFHNPSSFYRDAGAAYQAVEEAREKVAKLLNASGGEIYFTGGGTESDNLAIFGTVDKLKSKGNHIITSQIEHPAVLKSCQHLENQGYSVTYLPVDKNGIIEPEDLKKSITDQTILITVIFANNETGSIQPIKQLAEVARNKGNIVFHTDAVQAVGKIPVDVKDLGVDLLSFSSHKIYGPKGMGVLYKGKGTRITPQIFGGGHEKGLRGGTENVPGIIGLGKAAELAVLEMKAERQFLEPLRDRLQRELVKKIPEVLINGDTPHRLYNTLNISIKYIEGESIVAFLDQQGFAISSGSACSSKSLDPSHTLLAMGLSEEDAHGSLRISLGKYNTEDDVNQLIKVLPEIIKNLREKSPFWKG
jgi:cysteine desulfurase